MSAQTDRLFDLLNMRKDRRYRAGALQAAVMFGVITHEEWCRLTIRYNTSSVNHARRFQPKESEK